MKKILIVSIESNAKAFTPAGNEMRSLAEKLAKKNKVTLLTFHSKKSEISEKPQSENLRIDSVKNPKASFYRFFERQKNCRTRLGELLLNLYFALFQQIINRANYKPLHSYLEGQHETYDLIISVSNPFLNHDIAKEIKEKCHIPVWYLFFLDQFADAYTAHSTQEEVNRRKQKEATAFEACQKIFTTQPIFDHCTQLQNAKFKEKTVVVPDVFIQDLTHFCKEGDPDVFRVGYFGAFLPKIREPKKLFEILSRLPKAVLVDIYYTGCDTEVEKLEHGENVRLHDLIRDPERYRETVGKTDILINVGNLVANQIPSKIYDCIGFGKPMIHFYQDDEDFTLQKFSKYPLIRFVDYRKDPDLAAKEFLAACAELKGKTLSYEHIKELFGTDTIESFLDQYF